MKIALGTNYFGTGERQQKAKESHIKLARKFPDLKLYDIQFEDDPKESDGDYTTLNVLTRSSQTLFPEWDKKIPFVNDIMGALADLDVDYFIYTNSDILISDRLIKYIEETQPDTLACSRMDVAPFSDFNQILPLRWEIAGFDTFVFKKEWFLKHKFLFEDFLIGRPCWDHHYAGLVKIFGGNTPVGNKNPAFCMHVYHGAAALDPNNVGYKFNMDQMNNSKFRKFSEVWDDYCRNVLIRYRQPSGYFLQELKDEDRIETDFFNKWIESHKQEVLDALK